jgi:metal-dependent amidase/aminoacylase/carboxypeptidase family protein
MMASADTFLIRITGQQTQGAVPWGGIDPIAIGSQVVMGLQTIISRTVNITCISEQIAPAQPSG